MIMLLNFFERKRAFRAGIVWAIIDSIYFHAAFPETSPPTMRRLWLIFAQTATVALGVLFVMMTLKPEWLGRPQVIELKQAVPAASGAARSASYSEAVRRATPAVVNVFTSKDVKNPQHPFLNDPLFRHFFGERLDPESQRASSLGSGVIVSPKGYILTNHHVVEAADEIEIALVDGKKLKARLVGSDPETDLAVLHVPNAGLPSITFGDAEGLRVGDVVLAIGNPFGVGQTVTMGIVSALGRNQLGINTFENFIQTDAAINPGNSGAAPGDDRGNLIVINPATYSRSGGSKGLGFALPVSTAKLVLEGIVKDGVVTRGWIGVEPADLSPELMETFGVKAKKGVLITGVLQNGPAAQAGVRPGDVVVQVAGKDVANVSELLTTVASLKPGPAAQFKLQRREDNVEVTVTPGKRPKAKPQPPQAPQGLPQQR